MLDVTNFLKTKLTKVQLSELAAINNISNVDQRHTKLKNFFHNPLIFDSIKTTVDPTWLSFDIFKNGKYYEF
jgi:hypothetical protein